MTDHPPIAEHLATLRETPRALARLVTDHTPAVLRACPYDGKWTPNEILGHLVDHEIVCMSRIRTARFESVAWIGSYEQERWVAEQRHNERAPEQHVRRFTELRGLNVEQYESLSPAEWTAARRLPDGDEKTFEQIVARHAGHDLRHLDQLGRYVEAVGGSDAETLSSRDA